MTSYARRSDPRALYAALADVHEIGRLGSRGRGRCAHLHICRSAGAILSATIARLADLGLGGPLEWPLANGPWLPPFIGLGQPRLSLRGREINSRAGSAGESVRRAYDVIPLVHAR